MSDVRGLLTETLEAHRLERCARINTAANVRDLWGECVECGWKSPVQDNWDLLASHEIGHVADVLLALPVHIVPKVEADGATDEDSALDEWSAANADDYYVWLNRTWFKRTRDLMVTHRQHLTPSLARSLAAALLSAADVAEEGK